MNSGDYKPEDTIKWLHQRWEPLGLRAGVKIRAKIKVKSLHIEQVFQCLSILTYTPCVNNFMHLSL